MIRQLGLIVIKWKYIKFMMKNLYIFGITENPTHPLVLTRHK